MTAVTCIIVVQAFTRGLACNNHVKEWPMSFVKIKVFPCHISLKWVRIVVWPSEAFEFVLFSIEV